MIVLWLIALLALAGCALGIYSTIKVHEKQSTLKANPTNLKMENGVLNTIQDITSTSDVRFGTVDMKVLKLAGESLVSTAQLLGGLTFHNAVIESSVEGSNVLFTVPTGKKAVVTQFMLYNTSGGDATWYAEYDFGSGFTRFDGSTITQHLSGDGINAGYPTLILSANQRFSIRSDSPQVMIYASYVLFPESFPMTLYRTTASTTKSTLFTCPAGKVAYTISPTTGTYTTTSQLRAVCQTTTDSNLTIFHQKADGDETIVGEVSLVGEDRSTFNLGVLNGGDVVRVLADYDDLTYVYLAVAVLDQVS